MSNLSQTDIDALEQSLRRLEDKEKAYRRKLLAAARAGDKEAEARLRSEYHLTLIRKAIQ